MPISEEQISEVVGQSVTGANGEKIGKVGQVYLDDQTGRPEWVTVSTGLFGTKETFVPIAQASMAGGGLSVPYTKDVIKGAPGIDAEGHLSKDEEAQLYRHYGLDYGDDRSDSGLPEGPSRTGETDVYDQGRGSEGHDTSGANTDQAMTRSEERLRVGTEQRETGKVRLRKHIVTEQKTVTVPVQREEVRLEREPITEENRGQAMSGSDLTEEEHEVVLTEERPVVQKEVVPVERVKLAKEATTENVNVSEEVRKEQIDTDGLDNPHQR